MSQITVEVLQERLQGLNARREQLLADYNALTGAIRDVEYWLGVLAAEESEEPKEPDPEDPS